MKTRKVGVFFPENVDIPDELHKALQAFKLSQERYELAESKHNAAVQRGERASRFEVDRLESEYIHAAIFAANVALGRMTQ